MYDESKRFAESAVHAYVQTHGITGNIARNIWSNKEYYKIILDRDEYIIEALSHN